MTALRKPQIRGSWGETQLKRVAELAGMIERCDFDLQYTTKADDRVLRPDMRVNLSGGKHLFVDAKVPLNAFLEAAETDDPDSQGGGPDALRTERPDAYRSALLQAILEGRGDTGVRGALLAERDVLRHCT